ncbi:MAG: hypothetical protein GY773_21170 [Actinomycetia bacterium]|nr:hypothetical protein [Actinomycetes bacterium]
MTPRIGRTEAIDLVARAGTLSEIRAILAQVRPEDHAKVLRTADIRRTKATEVDRRAEWDDQPLPFGGVAQ